MEKTVVEYFASLVKIDSESKSELNVAKKVAQDLEQLGAKVVFDQANRVTGGNCGNLIAHFTGNIAAEPVMLCAHLDTVVPGKNIKPAVKDGVIRSDGTTVLGADDKSGIAQIIWAIKELKEKNESYPPIEILFTISEEIGLLGAKNCDYSLLKAKKCFAFDTKGVGSIMNGSPSQNNLVFTFYGKKAHAGVEPEKGINAIKMASEAIAKMQLGRIDEETTCNIGIISGGEATNIVPDIVCVEGEVRSHSEDKLKRVTDEICDIVKETAAVYQIGKSSQAVDIQVKKCYPSFYIEESDDLVQKAIKASEKLSIPLSIYRGGGGSDANILTANGIKSVVIGTGMEQVHTVDEHVSVADLELGVKWIKELLRLYSEEH